MTRDPLTYRNLAEFQTAYTILNPGPDAHYEAFILYEEAKERAMDYESGLYDGEIIHVI